MYDYLVYGNYIFVNIIFRLISSCTLISVFLYSIVSRGCLQTEKDLNDSNVISVEIRFCIEVKHAETQSLENLSCQPFNKFACERIDNDPLAESKKVLLGHKSDIGKYHTVLVLFNNVIMSFHVVVSCLLT